MILFHLPFDKNIYTCDENSSDSFLHFHSFEEDKIISFNGKFKSVDLKELQQAQFSLQEEITDSEAETKEEYLLKIVKAIKEIKENQLPKLVIARKKKITYSALDIPSTFIRLIENYPSAFAYAFEKNGECWIGAFSEILGQYTPSTQRFETMSLAGTLPIEEEWTEKEIEEQKPVTQYIADILKTYSKEVEISSTYDHLSVNIKHLRTDFKIQLRPERLDALIHELHPTPAVCGIPKDVCKKKIHQLEKFNREFYAGYTKIDLNDKIYYFVNLRCGRFYKHSAELFVGGGITALSLPENEWRETELKSQALHKNIVMFD